MRFICALTEYISVSWQYAYCILPPWVVLGLLLRCRTYRTCDRYTLTVHDVLFLMALAYGHAVKNLNILEFRVRLVIKAESWQIPGVSSRPSSLSPSGKAFPSSLGENGWYAVCCPLSPGRYIYIYELHSTASLETSLSVWQRWRTVVVKERRKLYPSVVTFEMGPVSHIMCCVKLCSPTDALLK